jgi:hypothetical protein
MKKLLLPALVLAWCLCMGCAASTRIRVIEQKGSTTPYTNILTIYLDETCNFSLADSTGYNICLKGFFEDTTKTALRSRMEKRIAEKLSTKGTEVFKSSDLLSFDNGSSYTYFKQLIDSLHIEGFLLVQLSSKSEEQMGSPPGGSPGPTSHAGPGVSASAGVSVSITLYTANFDCMLIDSKSLNSPKWKAQLESKQANSNRELQQNMARLLAKSLMSEGYIVMSAKASAKAHDTRGPEF